MNLTSQAQIETFVEQRLHQQLRLHAPSRLGSMALHGCDRVLEWVPYPLRRCVNFMTSVDALTPSRAILRPMFCLQSAFMGMVVAMGLLVGFIIALSPRALQGFGLSLITHCIEGGLAVSLVAHLWGNVLRLVSKEEAASVQEFCVSPERAQVVAHWIAIRGQLRARDWACIKRLQATTVSTHKQMLERVLRGDPVVVAMPSGAPLARMRAAIADLAAAWYGPDAENRLAVREMLERGTLGEHLQHAQLEHDTHPVALDPPKARL